MSTHRRITPPWPSRLAVAAACLAGLMCQGCASLVLTSEVQRMPQYSRPDEARSVQGSYVGLARAEGRWHYAFCFPDFVWTGSRTQREALVLVPAEVGQGRAIVAGGNRGDLREALHRALGQGPAAEELAGRQGGARSVGRPVKALVQPRRGTASPARQIGGEGTSAEHPAALEFRVGSRGQVEAVRVGWKAGSGLEWTAPYAVADHLEKPSWSDRSARTLTSLGYLVTVPLDVVTLPVQFVGALVILVALAAG